MVSSQRPWPLDHEARHFQHKLKAGKIEGINKIQSFIANLSCKSRNDSTLNFYKNQWHIPLFCLMNILSWVSNNIWNQEQRCWLFRTDLLHGMLAPSIMFLFRDLSRQTWWNSTGMSLKRKVILDMWETQLECRHTMSNLTEIHWEYPEIV